MSTNTPTVAPMSEDERDRLAAGDPHAGLGALQTGQGNLPLELIDVRATLTGLAGAVELTQRFTNPYDQPLEATYVFPLPDRFAVTGMRMTADGRTVRAGLRERAAARDEYDRAVAQGRRASIAEEERPDVFTMRVGNILPGERVTVALTLAGPLSYEDGAATFRFPLVVAPRYVPGAPLDGPPVGDGYAPDTGAVPDASRITPPVLLPGFPHPVRLSIEVTVDPAGLPLEQVRASLPTETGTDGVLRLAAGQRADQDFVLRLAYGSAAHPSPALILVPDVDGPGGTFQLTVLPPADAVAPRPRDLVLLLDRSGSMAGWKMVAARRAAARIVDTLGGADRFAVRTFDSVVERPEDLPAGLVAANDRHRFRAVEHLARAQARGGTELLAPLREGLALLTGDGAAVCGAPTGARPSPGEPASRSEPRDRVLVLVTDGQVGNEDQILREAGADLQRVRVHTVGIDRAVNAGFLGRLATFGGGRCELVESEDRLDEAMEHIHRRIAAPLVTGLTVDCAGLQVRAGTVSPARLPDLFPGAPVVLTGRYRRPPGGAPGRGGAGDPAAGDAGEPPAGALVVRGRDREGRPWQARVVGCPVEGAGVTAGWARAHLRDLEDRYLTAVAGGSPGGSDEPGEPDLAGLERQIVDTSLRFGVLCRFTAYVAVDSRVVTGGGQPHRVIQPVEPAAGWEMLRPAPVAQPVTLAALARPVAGAAATAGSAQPFAALAGPAARPGSRRRAGEAVPGLSQVPEQAAIEADRLRAASGASGPERRQLLDDLATRLAALVRDLTARSAGNAVPGAGTAPGAGNAVRGAGTGAAVREVVAQLARLLDAIRLATRPGDEAGLDQVWAQALRILGQLRDLDQLGDRAAPGNAAAPRRPAFWKR